MKWISVATATLWFVLSSLSYGSNIRTRANIKSISTAITRITDGISSQQSNQGSSKLSFSDNGRYVVFQSDASNLVSGDTNGVTDIFLYDSQTSTMTRLSIGLSSAEANGSSFDPVISGDGSTVAFVSYASNLVASDTNGKPDVFKVNLSTGTISRLSVTSSGTEGNGASGEPSISSDGNLVAFTSNATNLVSGDTNGVSDVFVRNISAGTTTRISVDSSSVQADKASYQPKISSNGSYVAFTSDATNLISSDTNGCSDIFLRNLSAGTTQLVSASSSGTLGNRSSFFADISQTGQYIVFQSRANNLIGSDTNGFIDIFMKNMSTGAVTLVSQTSSGAQVKYDSVVSSVSLDGRFVVFESKSPDFVNWDSNAASDVFIRDTVSNLTTPFSTLASNVVGNKKSMGARISGDGSKLGFVSLSTNLVTPDTNGQADVFVRANPLVGQAVNITPIANIYPTGSSQNAFTVTRYGDTSASLTVYYTVSGTAVAGTDYPTLSGSVTIAALSSTATISITPTLNTNVELNKSIILSLSDNAAYTVGGKNAATVLIINNNDFEVSVAATHNTLTKDGTEQGNFRISRTGGTLGDLIVNYTMSGTAIPGQDYVTLSGSATIPDGQAYVDVPLIGVDGLKADSDKSIIITLASGTGYHAGSSNSATATVRANGLYEVNIQAIDPILDASNISDTGTFRITRSSNSAQSLTVNYALRGSAINGVDFQFLTGVVTIPGGSQYVDVTVTAISNSTFDPYKSISVELIPGTLYTIGASGVASLIIKENPNLPVVSIATVNANASEDGSQVGTIRISRTGSTSASLTVNYTIGGTAANGVDYTSLSGTATISSGQSYVDVSITGLTDILVEPTETVVLALQATSTYVVDPVSSQAQVYILDNNTPIVQIFRESAYATKSLSAKAKVRVTRLGSLSGALTVNLNYSGSPVAGTDYVSPGSSVVIPAGNSSVALEVSALSGNSVQGNKVLTIGIGTSGSYSLGTASAVNVVIVDGNYKVFKDFLGIAPNADVSSLSVSDDGRYIAFASAASNLVSGDNNGVSDIFIVDTTLKTISRVMALGGAEPNGSSRSPMISPDGRYVVFSSKATNFSTDDQNGYEDVFLKDLSTGTVTYVSKGYTDSSQGGDSLNPFVTSNANYIAFESDAINLVPGDSNQATDIFLYTKATGALERVNIKPSSLQYVMACRKPSVSSDGNYVTFESRERYDGVIAQFTDIYLKNRQSGVVNFVSIPSYASENDGPSGNAIISSNGKYISYQSLSSRIVSNDTNAAADIFRYSVISQSNEAISKSYEGWLGNKTSASPNIDSTGDVAAFVSNARNFGGSFNCTNSVYTKAMSQKSIFRIENPVLGDCNASVRNAVMSSSGKFILSLVVSADGSKEVWISSNPLK